MSYTRIEEVELMQQTQDLMRFLIKDHAFSTDFLLTCIQEYYAANRPKDEGEATK